MLRISKINAGFILLKKAPAFASAFLHPVRELTEKEYIMGEGNIKKRVLEFFDDMGNVAYNKEVGDVALKRKGISHDLAHGLTPEKAVTFFAIPDVIENGKVVNVQKRWKGREVDTAVIAAKVIIGNDEYLEGVVIERPYYSYSQRYAVHEVKAIKIEHTRHQSRRPANSEANPTQQIYPTLESILQNVMEVNDRPNDLRFSLRDNKYLTDRELLASALENAAVTEEEKRMLSEYQKIAAKIDNDEERVKTINEKIRELRLEEPNTQEEQRLLEERRGLERGITNADRRLFQMEGLKPLQRIAKLQRKEAEAALDRTRKHLERYKEGVIEREYVDKIKKTSDRLAKWLTKPNNQQHVPEDLRKPLAEFLLAIDRGSHSMLTGGGMTKKDRDYARVIADLRDVISNINSYQNQLSEGGKNYNMYIDLPRGFVDLMTEHAQKMQKRADELGGRMTLNNMNSKELEELFMTLTAISSSITHTNDFLSAENAKHVGDVAQETITYLRAQKPVEQDGKVAEFLTWDNLQPVYAFERYGEGGKAVFKIFDICDYSSSRRVCIFGLSVKNVLANSVGGLDEQNVNAYVQSGIGHIEDTVNRGRIAADHGVNVRNGRNNAQHQEDLRSRDVALVLAGVFADLQSLEAQEHVGGNEERHEYRNNTQHNLYSTEQIRFYSSKARGNGTVNQAGDDRSAKHEQVQDTDNDQYQTIIVKIFSVFHVISSVFMRIIEVCCLSNHRFTVFAALASDWNCAKIHISASFYYHNITGVT